MEQLLREASELAEKVFRSSEGGSEMEELAMAMTHIIAYLAKRDGVELDEDDEY